MTSYVPFARALRLARLHHHSNRLLIVPLDHPVSTGPIGPPGTSVAALVHTLAATDVDAVVVHKGCLRQLDPTDLCNLSLIVHLSASTAGAPDPDAKVLVTGVEEAVRLGADAVSVHVNLGSREEPRQLADLGAVAERCDRWNVPLLAMMYPRGPAVRDPAEPELVAHAATVAAELGADLVKIPAIGQPAVLAEIVRRCPIPIVVAGGAGLPGLKQLADFVHQALLGGVGGVAVGRNIFGAPDPYRAARLVGELVHRNGDDAPAGGLAELTEEGGEHRGQRQAVLA